MLFKANEQIIFHSNQDTTLLWKEQRDLAFEHIYKKRILIFRKFISCYFLQIKPVFLHSPSRSEECSQAVLQKI